LALAAAGTGITGGATAAPYDTADCSIEFVEMDTPAWSWFTHGMILRENVFVSFFVLSAICMFPPRVPRFHVIEGPSGFPRRALQAKRRELAWRYVRNTQPSW
jgi:hypothetical protein